MTLPQTADDWNRVFLAMASIGKIPVPDWYDRGVLLHLDHDREPTGYLWGREPWRRRRADKFFYWTDDPYHWTNRPTFFWGAEIARDEAANR